MRISGPESSQRGCLKLFVPLSIPRTLGKYATFFVLVNRRDHGMHIERCFWKLNEIVDPKYCFKKKCFFDGKCYYIPVPPPTLTWAVQERRLWEPFLECVLSWALWLSRGDLSAHRPPGVCFCSTTTTMMDCGAWYSQDTRNSITRKTNLSLAWFSAEKWQLLCSAGFHPAEGYFLQIKW